MMMKSLTPAVIIGVILFTYVRLFNHTMDIYKKSDYTLSWDEYFHKSFQLDVIRGTSS
jgi:hypothetical protein